MNILSQRNPQWKDIKLGAGTGTIGDYGCTLVCISMMMGVTPDVANEKIKAVNGFGGTTKNLIAWGALPGAFPQIESVQRVTTYDNEQVSASIAKNGACLVEVDFDGKITTPSDSHWVLFVGNGKMYDPWTGVEKSTGWYPILKGFAVINIKEVTNNSQCEADLAEQRKQVSNLQTQVNGLLADIKSWETKYNECNQQRIEATSSSDGFRSQLNALVAQLATKLGTRQEVPEILASVDTCLTFEDANAELQKKLSKEESDHQQAIEALEAKIKTLESNLETLKADLKAVKDTQIIPTQLPQKGSIISWILNLIGVHI